MAVMLRTALLADVPLPGDAEGTFDVSGTRNTHR
jgi:hypothetical protein